MSKAFLLDVNSVKQKLLQLFQKQRIAWLHGEGKWPLIISLGLPQQKSALNNITAVGAWIAEWRKCAGQVQWCVRDWNFLGAQQLPEKIIFANVAEVVQWINQTSLWNQISNRHTQLIERWPQLKLLRAKYIDALEKYSAEDFTCLQKVLAWLIENTNSQIYLRQLPISGVDSKWIENRKAIIFDLLKVMKNSNDTSNDFFEFAGFKKEPALIRMRMLDQDLRNKLNGLGEICASADELSQLKLTPQKVFIVENLRTGLAFHDIPGTIIFMGLGYSVNQLKIIPWIHSADCYYWGDLDTHGFAILNRARSHFPKIKSLLMDEETLFKAKDLWVQEPKPCRIEDASCLTETEKNVYTHLRDNKWGYQIRLEQERILWQDAWEVITYMILN